MAETQRLDRKAQRETHDGERHGDKDSEEQGDQEIEKQRQRQRQRRRNRDSQGEQRQQTHRTTQKDMRTRKEPAWMRPPSITPFGEPLPGAGPLRAPPPPPPPLLGSGVPGPAHLLASAARQALSAPPVLKQDGRRRRPGPGVSRARAAAPPCTSPAAAEPGPTEPARLPAAPQTCRYFASEVGVQAAGWRPVGTPWASGSVWMRLSAGGEGR